MRSATRPTAVYWALAAGILCFSISPILIRYADDAPGMTIAVWRTVIAALLLLPFAGRIGPEIRQLTRREKILILTAGILLGLHFIIWIESLYHTSVASASVLVTTSPIFMALFGFWFLRERLRRQTIAAILIAVAGSVLIGLGDAGQESFPNALFGNSLALSAALLVTIYLLIGRVVRRRVSWMAYVFPLYSIVALTALTVALWRGVPLLGYGWEFYGVCALMAICPQIIGHGSFNYAIKYFPAAILGLLALSEPVLASVLAIVLFGEIPGLLAVLGILTVLAGVSTALLPDRKRKPVDIH